jgi:hypothetical protein
MAVMVLVGHHSFSGLNVLLDRRLLDRQITASSSPFGSDTVRSSLVGTAEPLSQKPHRADQALYEANEAKNGGAAIGSAPCQLRRVAQMEPWDR